MKPKVIGDITGREPLIAWQEEKEITLYGVLHHGLQEKVIVAEAVDSQVDEITGPGMAIKLIWI